MRTLATVMLVAVCCLAPGQDATADELSDAIAAATATMQSVEQGTLQGDQAYEGLMSSQGALDRVIEANPDAWAAFDTRARTKMAYGQYAGAVRDFQAAVDAYRRSPPKFPDPNIAMSLSTKADVQYERLGYLDPAIDSLLDGQKLLKELVVEIERIRGGKSGAAWDNLEATIRDARVAINQSLLTAFLEHPARKAEALKAFEHALEVLPDDFKVRMKYGELLVRESRSGEAVTAYHKAMDLNADAVAPWCKLGGVHHKLMSNQLRLDDKGAAKSQYNLAVDAWEVCLKSNPQNADVLLSLVNMSREIENKKKTSVYQDKLDKVWGR